MFDFLKAAKDQCVIMFADDKMYVSAGKIRDGIIRQASLPKGLSKADSLFDMVQHFGVDYKFFTRSKTNPTVVDITIAAYKRNHRSYQIGILFSSITATTAIAGLIQQTWPQYMKATPANEEVKSPRKSVDLEEDYLDEKHPVPTTEPKVASSNSKMLYLSGAPCLVITLDDHEQFTDDGHTVRLEFRGERTPTGLLINAEDVAKAFGIGSQFVRKMLQRDIYAEDEHYVILQNALSDDPTQSSSLDDSQNIPSDDPTQSSKLDDSQKSGKYGQNRLTYFKWFGFMKVIFTTARKSNEFRTKMSNWVVNTMFVHQLGSTDERKALANELTLFNSCLNDLTGIYLIRIGKVKDLRESMRISYEKYPVEFDRTYVYKYGRSKHVLARYKEHITGYAPYSDRLQLTWFAILPPGKDIKAEKSIADYFDDRNLNFEFTSDDGHKYSELVILKKDELIDVNARYRQLIAKHPSADNEIAMIVDRARMEYASQLMEMTHKYEREQSLRQQERAESQLKLAELEGKNVVMALEHQLEIKEKDHKIELIAERFESFKIQADLRDEVHQLKLAAAARV